MSQEVFKEMPIHILLEISGTVDSGVPAGSEPKVVRGRNGQLFRLRHLSVRGSARALACVSLLVTEK